MNQDTGKGIILIGLLVIVAGVLVYLFHDKLHWFGRLPGDVRVERQNFRFYAPLTTMLLASAALSLILWLVRRFL
jgi:hypothetical protein